MIASTAATLAAMAIVTQDATALRASASDNAAQQAQLWQGDLLEVRGRRGDHLQVWDHRRERAGYVRATQVRQVSLQAADAPQLLAVLRFLRDQPGAEALGMAYVAAYLKAVPAQAITAEPFDALGTMAERLARRASQRQASTSTAAHLEVAAQYGVRYTGFERQGVQQLCYDGDAFRRVLALPANPEQRALASLALTRHDCQDPALSSSARLQADLSRAQLLDQISDADTAVLPDTLKNRLRLRRAGIWAGLAFERARQGQDASATAVAGQRALEQLAAVDKSALTDDDLPDAQEAALRVGASRWAARLPIAGTPAAARPARLRLSTRPGEPGQTCVELHDEHSTRPLAQRCTYGVVWTASAHVESSGKALAVAVQPLQAWRELWLFQRGEQGWRIDVLPPAANDPELGYLEFSGWVPGSQKLLITREARDGKAHRRSFEVLLMDTLEVDKRASDPTLLALFGKWQDPAWKRETVALR